MRVPDTHFAAPGGRVQRGYDFTLGTVIDAYDDGSVAVEWDCPRDVGDVAMDVTLCWPHDLEPIGETS